MDLDLTSIDEVLTTTRSVRRRLDFERPVETEVLLECIDQAVQAPTGISGESWRFMVVTEAERKAALAELYRETIAEFERQRGIEIKPTQQALMDRLHEMPAMILVCIAADPPGENLAEQIGFYGSILPAAWSLMLALRARGLGSTWTSLLAGRQREVGEVVDMPEGVIHTVMLPVAYTLNANLKPANRLPARAVTFWDQWGQQAP